GPPFANGLPHYGHLLTGYVKDAVPRYHTMRGRRVERRFGWDCHGLPAEMAAERDLGLSGRQQILDYGVDRFNAYCRSLVDNTAGEWDDYVTRQARWVDMADDYKTMDLSYMESVMWAQKQLYDKGLLYESYRVLPYCWECETPLSNFETRQDDAYRERQDPAVTVLFQLETGEKVLVWTTTPWTLPSNLALAVGPDIEYSVYEESGVRYIVGAATAAKYEKELASASAVGSVLGRELVGRSYTPLFGYFAEVPNAFRVLEGDFVSTEDGTGVVHMAPGFGEDDQRVCEANGIPLVVPVDSQGRFTADVPDFAGLQVFDANAPIIKALKEKGAIVRHDSYLHSYPHCWRTDTPLIYKAVSSWFVRVTAIKERMLELNQEIGWVPEHVRDGAFGKWLESARDWSISRNRFWGSPIPVWKSDNPDYPRIDVYGSLDELERDFGVRLTDLHRPAVDELTRPNPDDPTGQSTMRRIEDVLDCWFESGSMPFAQVHYPFESKEWFEGHFPADFICEYVGQTRGWFYTLHVLSTALFDRPAFSNCVAHGVLLGHDGRKLSKRLANYPDPIEVFNELGADAMRWALLSSAGLRGQDLVVERKAMAEPVRQVLNPIWNAWYFFSLYANTEGYQAVWRTDAPGVLDRYVLAKTGRLVSDVGERMDAYDLSGACASVVSFLDALNNWYIRRSRDRFWAGDHDAFDTLYTVLEVLCRVAAPLLPLTTEAVYRGLTGARSVHLADWPTVDALPTDDGLVASMDLAREVCSAGLSVRKERRLRVRLPLPRLTVAAPGAAGLAGFESLIADEVNVRSVVLTDDVGDAGELVLSLNMAVLGPRLGPDTQKVLGAVRSGQWTRASDGTVTVGDRVLAADEFTLRLTPADPASARALPGDAGLVVLDTAVTPELEAEGLARDVVRLVQVARKESGLHVSDRIHLVIDVGHHHDVGAAVAAHRDYVMAETLALELVLDGPLADPHRGELPDGRAIHIGLSKAP
ncbi:MAG TPA: isoleucine--tRNA ligase, partial [Acidimicrobiales bacterium]|nr:isoleucine--tRNA ligase [Acidimicrobiales bacterium]